MKEDGIIMHKKNYVPNSRELRKSMLKKCIMFHMSDIPITRKKKNCSDKKTILLARNEKGYC
jgi:hypothetical protein